jgi:hypothetical protein
MYLGIMKKLLNYAKVFVFSARAKACFEDGFGCLRLLTMALRPVPLSRFMYLNSTQ